MADVMTQTATTTTKPTTTPATSGGAAMSEYRKWLAEAGYRTVETFDTRRSHSPVIIATK